jgi:hypothetical protein
MSGSVFRVFRALCGGSVAGYDAAMRRAPGSVRGSWRWRRIAGLACGVAVLSVAVFAGQAAASGVSCDCVGSYSGTWDAQVSYGSNVTASLSVGWTESLVQVGNGQSTWKLTSVSSNSGATFSDPGPPDTSCTSALVANPAIAGNWGDEFGPQVTEGSTSIMIDPWPPTWWSSAPSADPLVSSPASGNAECDDTSLETAYEGGFWTFSGNDCHTQISVPLGRSSTVPDNCSATGSDPEATGTGSLQSTLTIASCPDPADNALIAQADAAASDIFDDDFDGHSFGRTGVVTGDHLADYAVLEIKLTAANVKRKFPLMTEADRAKRKDAMNQEMRKLDALLARARASALSKAAAVEASFLARAVCEEAKQKIRMIFDHLTKRIDDQYRADLKFIANEVVGATNLFCGCHL